ncbi:MAG: MBL fold metallo-hydrolase [bacterium]
MKKPLKRSLIGLAIAVGVLLLIVLGFFLSFYIASRELTPAETIRINDSVFCIKDQYVNVYVFKGKTGYFMVDAGVNAEGIKAGLDKFGITPEQINTILLTHSDADHDGGIGLFKNVRIYMHKEEKQMIDGTNGKFFFLRVKWKFGPYTLLDNLDTLTVDGIKVKIFHTRGHTPGSSCYLVGNDYLVTGDNLAYKNGEFDHFISLFNMNTTEQEISIKSLPNPDSIRYVLTAHHGIVRNDE